MFYLRQTHGKKGVQKNHTIGENYELISRVESPENFRHTFREFFNKPHVADTDPTADYDTINVYAFIWNPHFYMPLYKDRGNFIMTEKGSTFANISF